MDRKAIAAQTAENAPSPRAITRFVILTSQRSGSTLLVRSLDSSARILCAGEIFHVGTGIHRPEFRYPHEFLWSVRLGRMRDALRGQIRIRRHLANFFQAAGSPVEAIGFKLMVSQLRQFPAIMPTLTELGVRIFFLYRDDSLAAAISYCRAKATGVFHSDRANVTPAQQVISIDEEEFRRVLVSCRSDKEELVRLHRIHGGILIRYEDMVADWNDFIDRLGAALGIVQLQVSRALSKLSSGIDSARIANEDSLLAKFGRSGVGPASNK